MCTILDAVEKEEELKRNYTGRDTKINYVGSKESKKGDSIAKIADDLVEDEIVISPIYKMVKNIQKIRRDIYQRLN